MSIFNNTIRITECSLLSPLPELLRSDAGMPVTTAEAWAERKKEILRTAVDMQYGTIPPKAEVLDVEPLYLSGTNNTYLIHAGTREKQLTFRLILAHPDHEGPYRTAVDGDGCWQYAYDRDWFSLFAENDYALAFFDRTELAHDIFEDGRRGQLYDVYPDFSFGAVGAWAWGFRTVTDALEKLGLLDPSLLAYTGHSRGGKAALLAGVIDERAAIVNPNESGAGGAGCYRVHMKAIDEDGHENRNETLADLYRSFPFWVGEAMAAYTDNEAALPFDEHFLKALIAPRILLTGDAASDIWANPVGSWLTTRAAADVYRLLDAEDNLIWYYRNGYHCHKPEDIRHLIDIMNHVRSGKKDALALDYYMLPFEIPENLR